MSSLPPQDSTPTTAEYVYQAPSKQDVQDNTDAVETLTTQVHISRKAVKLISFALAIIVVLGLLGIAGFWKSERDNHKLLAQIHATQHSNASLLTTVKNSQHEITGIVQFIADSQNPKSKLGEQAAANTARTLEGLENCLINAVSVNFFGGAHDPACPIVQLYKPAN